MNSLLKKSFSKGNFEVFDDKPDHLNLIHITQTHSNIIITEENYKNLDQEGDGLIFSYQYLKENKSALAVKTADCLPIVYLAQDKVALIHAGWRGVANQIYLDKKLIDINPHTIFIGPGITAKNFEVQEDFKNEFPTSPNFIQKSQQLFFDLFMEATSQLEKTFPNAQIETSNICTFENNQYNSYRRDKTPKRNWNTFKIEG